MWLHYITRNTVNFCNRLRLMNKYIPRREHLKLSKGGVSVFCHEKRLTCWTSLDTLKAVLSEALFSVRTSNNTKLYILCVYSIPSQNERVLRTIFYYVICCVPQQLVRTRELLIIHLYTWTRTSRHSSVCSLKERICPIQKFLIYLYRIINFL